MVRNNHFNFSRRMLLAGAGALAFVLSSFPLRKAVSASVDIKQPGNSSPRAFMERAYQMREEAVHSGDQSYGAVVVRNGEIVGQSQSLVVLNGDPTAHSEMEAIRDAARRLGNRDLSGCILYSSSRPCPMCEAAAYWSGVERMVYGRDLNDAGAPRLCG